MGVRLPPLEFTECMSDSPSFRENLHKHEKELENTNQQIKRLIKEVKDLLDAAKCLSNAQRSFAKGLQSFTFECIGGTQTDDERIISRSLQEFGKLINAMEDERDNMLRTAHDRVTLPLEMFRKKHIADVKSGKKKFDKQTAKFCQSQERYLNLTTKKQNSTSLLEADASVDMAERCFYNASMDYVYLIQEVHERKKFEFVETLLSFMFGWLTFYHQGYETAKDFTPYMNDLQFKIQKTRDNFEDYRSKLRKRMAEIQKQTADEPVRSAKGEKSGYLFLLEKKAFGATWTKHYCTYNKERKEFSMLPYNQLTTKSLVEPEIMVLASCIRRMSDSIDKRFCFDLQNDSKPGSVYTFQALSENDRKAWMDIMDGKEPTYTNPVRQLQPTQNAEERILDDTGIQFVQRCIEVLETRGLEEQGLYRVVGVMSKVSKLLGMGLDRRKGSNGGGGSGSTVNSSTSTLATVATATVTASSTNNSTTTSTSGSDVVSGKVVMLPCLEDPQEWETKTITSALKCYLRNLPEPLMTYRYHNGFIAAVKSETRQTRINDVHTLVYRLPALNFEVLKILIKHLSNVAAKHDKNLMTVSNLSVCFGPTLLRPEEETVAAIVDLKFYNVVVEILIDNYQRIFHSEPPEMLSTSTLINTNLTTGGHTSPVLYGTTTTGGTTVLPVVEVVDNGGGTSPFKGHVDYGSRREGGVMMNNPVKMGRGGHVYNQPLTCTIQTYYDPTTGNNISASMYNVHEPNNGATGNNYPMTKSDYTSHNNTNGGGHPMPPLLHNRVKKCMNMAGGISSQSESNIPNLHNNYSPTNFIGYSHLGEPNSTSSSNESVSSNSRDGGNNSYLNNHMSPEKPHSNRSNSIGMPYPQSYRPQGAVTPFNTTSARSSPVTMRVRRVRTLYACVGENDGELSFEPNQIITNVKSSQEPGWLEGTLNGRTGLIPENYVEMLP